MQTFLVDSYLFLTNTLSRRKEIFTPRYSPKIKIFTCGPSVYRRPHLGNYRTFLYEDILQRYLEYLGYKVQRVINLTDIEDKTIAEANQKNTSIQKITEPIETLFLEEAEKLKIKLPAYIPRASNHVEQAVNLIKTLLNKGYAYRHKNDIFYDPLKFPSFGKLFGLDMSHWPQKKVRFRKDTYSGLRWNLGDFILWHGYKGTKDDTFWDTEIGKGRPSWNIQDPAIISKILGYEIDICCGGIDNLYRHHDYNLAIMESLSDKKFANYWLHGQHLLVDGKKMSKSKGNIIYPEHIYSNGWSPYHLRFYLVSEHYRKKLNYTEKNFQEMCERLDFLRNTVQEVLVPSSEENTPDNRACELINRLSFNFQRHLNDDLNISNAFELLQNIAQELYQLKREQKLHRDDCKKIEKEFKNIDYVLQFIF